MSENNNINKTAGKLSEIFNHASDLSVSRARQLCSDHLGGDWKNLTDSDIDLSVIQGGFVNRIWLCRNLRSNSAKTSQVVIRLYGGKMLSKNNDIFIYNGIAGEVLTYHVLAEQKVGPRLLGVFEGGRIEEYISESDLLSNEDITNPEIMAAFARKLAKIHSLDMPFTKKPKDTINVVKDSFANNWEGYADYVKKIPEQESPMFNDLIKHGLNYNWTEAISWFEEKFAKIGHKIVFCHNDTNRSNCLVKADNSLPVEERIILLDFEFSSYNYRGCDIGSHFQNRMFDMKKFSKLNKMRDMLEERMSVPVYPTEDERRHFIAAYLEEYQRLCPERIDDKIDTVDHILLEAEFFGGLHQLLFTHWVMKDYSKFERMEWPMPPPAMLGGIARSLGERKENVIKLLSEKK